MPTKIRYNGTEIATVAAGESKILECSGKKMLTNVAVEMPSEYIIPAGTKSITENGTFDVTQYASAEVNVALPQLSAPTIALDGDTLTITANADNGAFATSYDLYIDGSLVGNYTSTTIDLTTLGLAAGTYSVTTRAKGTNFVDSEDSNVVSYVMAAADCLTFSSPSSFTLSVNDNTKSWDGNLEYSYDKNTWSEWDGTTTISADSGILYMRGTGNAKITGDTNYRWILTGSEISCVGNIENLLDYATVANGEHPTMDSFCYAGMFMACSSLVSAPELPAMTLTSECYWLMFCGCTNLSTAPALPATELAFLCYGVMFYGCTSLRNIPVLPATTLKDGCYATMFQECTSLKVSTEYSLGEYDVEYRIPTSGTGTTATDALAKMFDGTGGTFTGTPTINTTYYLHSSNTVV